MMQCSLRCLLFALLCWNAAAAPLPQYALHFVNVTVDPSMGWNIVGLSTHGDQENVSAVMALQVGASARVSTLLRQPVLHVLWAPAPSNLWDFLGTYSACLTQLSVPVDLVCNNTHCTGDGHDDSIVTHRTVPDAISMQFHPRSRHRPAASKSFRMGGIGIDHPGAVGR